MLKRGVGDHKKLVGAAVLVSVALFLIGRLFFSLESGETTVSDDPRQTRETTVNQAARNKNGNDSLLVDPRLRLTQLELTEDKRYEGSGRNIFGVDSEHVPKHIPPAPAPIPSPPTVPAAEPTIPLRFFGFVSMLDIPRRGFFGDGDALFIAREGEIVDRRYRILRIDVNSVEVEDPIAHLKRTLSLPG